MFIFSSIVFVAVQFPLVHPKIFTFNIVFLDFKSSKKNLKQSAFLDHFVRLILSACVIIIKAIERIHHCFRLISSATWRALRSNIEALGNLWSAPFFQHIPSFSKCLCDLLYWNHCQLLSSLLTVTYVFRHQLPVELSVCHWGKMKLWDKAKSKSSMISMYPKKFRTAPGIRNFEVIERFVAEKEFWSDRNVAESCS